MQTVVASSGNDGKTKGTHNQKRSQKFPTSQASVYSVWCVSTVTIFISNLTKCHLILSLEKSCPQPHPGWQWRSIQTKSRPRKTHAHVYTHTNPYIPPGTTYLASFSIGFSRHIQNRMCNCLNMAKGESGEDSCILFESQRGPSHSPWWWGRNKRERGTHGYDPRNLRPLLRCAMMDS